MKSDKSDKGRIRSDLQISFINMVGRKEKKKNVFFRIY